MQEHSHLTLEVFHLGHRLTDPDADTSRLTVSGS
jgi:hypothetical protein